VEVNRALQKPDRKGGIVTLGADLGRPLRPGYCPELLPRAIIQHPLGILS